MTTADGLSPAADCRQLESALRERAIAEYRANLERVREFLAESSGLPCPVNLRPDAGFARTSVTSAPPPSSGAPSQVSRTNNQVAGVDEADMVKSTADGLIYVANQTGLHVLDAWPAETAREIARVQLPGTPRQLFVEGSRAVVYSALGGSGQQCTYGYDCSFAGDGSRTHVTIVDVDDPANPKIAREIELSGSLLAARRIGSTVHTVVGDRGPSFPFAWPSLLQCGRSNKEELEQILADDEQRFLERVRSTEILSRLPSLTDSLGATPRQGCEDMYLSESGSGNDFTSVVSFDMARDEPARVTSIVSRPGPIYASEQSLYMATRSEGVLLGPGSRIWGMPAPGGGAPARETSVVHRFSLGAEPDATRYEASGTVPGHVLNQFAMDEWQGHLRIATTTGWVPDPATHSTFSVLAQRGRALEVVGQVGQIAPTEDIRSVRFAGPRGYVVTFKKTDPLFVVGLEDPRAPKVLGELKIPGFSTYMHPLDAENLLTIGYDADDQGSFAYFTGVLFQIFDVSDPNTPRLRHKHVVGTRGSSSEALTNHLAFNYFAEKKLLAAPMTICEGGQSGSFGNRMTFSGLMLLDVDLDKGIAERGRVAHPPLRTGTYDSALCQNWWTQASSIVKRSVFMDDFVYSVAEDVVRVQHLDALGRDLATVPLMP